MRAVLLAGGRGTRLRPFTTTIPKPLVPVGDIPIMELLLRQLAARGCDRVTVAVGHMAQLIMAYFGDGERWGLSIDYSVEDEPLNTIGPLKLIPDLPEHFLVMNGDLLTDLDMSSFYESHVRSGAVGTVATYERDVKIDFGVLRYDDARRVTCFVEKPVEHFSVSMGIYAFSREILELVPAGEPFGFDELMIASVERGLDVRAYPHEGYWLDIGRPDDYDRANRDVDALIKRVLG
jgi:NDP-sugar pyrophosphorylase family protein